MNKIFSMVFSILKSSAIDFWEESIYLILFNIFLVIAIVPGVAFSIFGTVENLPILQWVTFLWFIPAGPFVFALFYATYDIVETRVIKVGTYFQHLKAHWREAMVWGAVNAIVVSLLRINYLFAQQLSSSGLGILTIFFMLLSLLWIMWQLVALAMYPHLKTADFRLAMQNALGITSHYIWADIYLVVFVILIGLVTLRLNLLGVFVSFSITAVFVSRLIDTIIKQELEKRR